MDASLQGVQISASRKATYSRARRGPRSLPPSPQMDMCDGAGVGNVPGDLWELRAEDDKPTRMNILAFVDQPGRRIELSHRTEAVNGLPEHLRGTARGSAASSTTSLAAYATRAASDPDPPEGTVPLSLRCCRESGPASAGLIAKPATRRT